MYRIRSTYEEYAPEFDDYPQGRDWPGPLPRYSSAWDEVARYLIRRCGWAAACNDEGQDGLAPYGHTEPTACYGDTTVLNDAETITITTTTEL